METVAPTVVAGRYELERLLGQGGMGAVWLARDRRSGDPVAVKRPREGLAMASIELEVCRRLDHPNIVPLLDFGWEDDRPFLVFPYVDAPTLREVLAAGRIAGARVARMGVQLASALAHAHGEGVIHNDIKPENILMSGSRAMLADFGAAIQLDATLSASSADALTGTVAYLAPEVLMGARPSVASDVYSLALVLYECGAGSLPWRAPAGGDLAMFRLHSAPPPLHALGHSVPAELDAALGRALSPLPSMRPASAAAFAALLQPVREPTERIAPPFVTAQRAARPQSGHPARRAAAVLGGIAALLAAGGAVAMTLDDDGNDSGADGAVPSPATLGAASATPERTPPAPVIIAPATPTPRPPAPTPTLTPTSRAAAPGNANPEKPKPQKPNRPRDNDRDDD